MSFNRAPEYREREHGALQVKHVHTLVMYTIVCGYNIASTFQLCPLIQEENRVVDQLLTGCSTAQCKSEKWVGAVLTTVTTIRVNGKLRCYFARDGWKRNVT